MVRPQPFVTPPHHRHITSSLYSSLSLWLGQTLRLYFHSYPLHVSLSVCYLHRSSLAWLGRSLPALLALIGTHTCLRSYLLNTFLYLYSISTPVHSVLFRSLSRVRSRYRWRLSPEPGSLVQNTSSDIPLRLIDSLPRLLHSPHINSIILFNHSLTSTTTALYTIDPVRHTAYSSVVRYPRGFSPQPYRLS